MNEPPSPCTGVCRIDRTTGWCLGCRRTIQEIAGWSGLSSEARRAVLALVARRGGSR
ncbi:Protein of unknown function [Novosphingobium sp. CF614]|uniref:DUF1289 domain-containing protein n=1 Tax=Novosphingobium sp. CF614 TaxID=1884364 RepID=UPI0008E08C98|nr:DUF1289 domain-containing protein [Novosphingobium sp. CF614]SFF77884.1 Protein of unknown function [Novosphingobium sp. CF614]